MNTYFLGHRQSLSFLCLVCILIALLALGIRNIRLGPTLPPFLSPGVVRTLQERYGLKPIATPEADLQAILGG